jgi:hypothetical protein
VTVATRRRGGAMIKTRTLTTWCGLHGGSRIRNWGPLRPWRGAVGARRRGRRSGTGHRPLNSRLKPCPRHQGHSSLPVPRQLAHQSGPSPLGSTRASGRFSRPAPRQVKQGTWGPGGGVGDGGGARGRGGGLASGGWRGCGQFWQWAPTQASAWGAPLAPPWLCPCTSCSARRQREPLRARSKRAVAGA